MKKKIIESIQNSENPTTIAHSFRTAVAVVISLTIARLLGLPDAHWAPISTLVVTQSTLKASFSISVQRFAGTALGAFIGAIVATFFLENSIAFGVGVFAIGVLCSRAHVDRAAYRYAGITLAIVMLIPQSGSSWTPAIHRFTEVSLGIAVGLAVTALWPEKRKG
jgi:uncharacterized membrane protein YgaE (UPF0421/DUF939 family)